MSDLTAFLRTRLDEDEALAKRATPGPWRQEGMGVWGQPPSYAASAGETLVIRHTWPQEADHILRHDPARVLREVEAKRAIMTLHKIDTAYVDSRDDEYRPVKVPELTCYWCGWASDVEGSGCATLRHLAAIYSDHPDYRQEWKS